MFLKYRTTWAWGVSTWDYVDLSDEEGISKEEKIEDFIDRTNGGYQYSDKFRGVEAIEEMPPKQWFDKRILFLKTSIKDFSAKLKRYRKLVKVIIGEETVESNSGLQS